jgi:sporulation protein YlmC with PRC-barrel domain
MIKFSAPKSTLWTTVLAMAFLAPIAQSAVAQVVGATRLGVTTIESRQLATGWSARNSILGQDLFNELGENIGKVEDLIVDRRRNVSYLIVGVGGFIGMGRHAVAIPASQLRVQGDRIVLPGADRITLSALPPFVYVPLTRSHSTIVARAERDIDKSRQRIVVLESQSETASTESKQGMEVLIAEIRKGQLDVENKIADMIAADDAGWMAIEQEVRKAAARLRKAVQKSA